MSKLGCHISAGRRDGLGAFLSQCHMAGSPVPVLLTLDQDVYADVVKYSPLTNVIFRTQPFGDDNPPDLYSGNAVESADRWYQLIKAKWEQNHAHYYAPLNEPNPAGESQCKWLSAFMIRLCDLAEHDEIQLAMFGASSGTPDYPDWQWLRPAMRRMQSGDHVLLLHEYGLDRGTLRASAPDLALRYREVRYILGDDCPDIVIGEASSGAGYSSGDDAAWLADVQWYDSELMRDSYVIGACLYQLGGAENFDDLLPKLGNYISVHPTVDPQPVPDPDDELEARVDALELQVADLEHRVLTLETAPPQPQVKAQGIDVSHWQLQINWTTVAESRSFAFIKATENITTDARFADNWKNAKAAGMLRGAYHYFHFGVDPLAQANHFLAALGNDIGELPPVVDAEDKSIEHPNIAELKQFIDAVQSRIGRKCIIYTGAWYWNEARWGGPVPWAHEYDLWVANYNVSAPLLPTDWQTWRFWQFSNKGQVDGITPVVDLDLFNGTFSALQAYAAAQPQPPIGLHSVPIGLHDRADGEDHNAPYFKSELQCVDTAHLHSLMVHTGDTFESLDAFIAHGAEPSLCVLGLTMAGDDPNLGKPAVYYDLMRAWLTRYAARGGKWIEIHNEPNLPDEGFGVAWKTVSQFGGWFDAVARLIRGEFPQLKIIFPAISINGVTPAQLNEWLSTMQSSLISGTADAIGCHVYWPDAAGIDNIESGRAYRKFAGLRSGGQPAALYITEAANIGTVDSDAVKGQQYKAYCAAIEAQVVGVVFFCSSATNPQFNATRQTWIRGGAVTDIAKAVGA